MPQRISGTIILYNAKGRELWRRRYDRREKSLGTGTTARNDIMKVWKEIYPAFDTYSIGIIPDDLRNIGAGHYQHDEEGHITVNEFFTNQNEII